jgi:hypothetical protein
MKRPDKRRMVLEIYDREAMGEITPREIAIIRQALLDEFGEGGAMSPAEIARVLSDEDLPIRFDQVLAMMPSSDPYGWLADEILSCTSLAEAESAIHHLDENYQRFHKAADRAGQRAVREAAIAGKRQAIENAAQEVNESQQKIFLEIAQWLTVWLQNPEVFTVWLELRKNSQDFTGGNAQRNAESE